MLIDQNQELFIGQLLLKARAIENQSYMIGVNRNGVDGNGLEYDESSSVFSPTGEKLEPF